MNHTIVASFAYQHDFENALKAVIENFNQTVSLEVYLAGHKNGESSPPFPRDLAFSNIVLKAPRVRSFTTASRYVKTVDREPVLEYEIHLTVTP